MTETQFETELESAMRSIANALYEWGVQKPVISNDRLNKCLKLIKDGETQIGILKEELGRITKENQDKLL